MLVVLRHIHICSKPLSERPADALIIRIGVLIDIDLPTDAAAMPARSRNAGELLIIIRYS